MGWPANGRGALDGREPAGGRGAGGRGIAGVVEREVSDGGRGARGPDRTWPGRGAVGLGVEGMGRAGGAAGRPGAITAAGGVA